ncbi:unnamed protein product [Enterobius vermicularis]|uniref:C2 domain-containing protein n=1 Tax=Enterobius vermicularis TaxID=51028 RepID=A0A0N4USE1_ENTVE|nr:unnamed protein product [Enterobius vermicularis]
MNDKQLLGMEECSESAYNRGSRQRITVLVEWKTAPHFNEFLLLLSSFLEIGNGLRISGAAATRKLRHLGIADGYHEQNSRVMAVSSETYNLKETRTSILQFQDDPRGFELTCSI